MRIYCLDADPRILQDVQRVLRLKARREARLLAQNSAAKSELGTPDIQRKLHAFPVIAPSPPARKESLSSDIDFSPLVGAPSVHPVPASLDNGITLDWSGFTLGERSERRWKLSTTKRKGKEQLPHLSVVVDQQEKAYSGKIR